MTKCVEKIRKVEQERADIDSHIRDAKVKLGSYQIEAKFKRRELECAELSRVLQAVEKDNLSILSKLAEEMTMAEQDECKYEPYLR